MLLSKILICLCAGSFKLKLKTNLKEETPRCKSIVYKHSPIISNPILPGMPIPEKKQSGKLTGLEHEANPSGKKACIKPKHSSSLPKLKCLNPQEIKTQLKHQLKKERNDYKEKSKRISGECIELTKERSPFIFPPASEKFDRSEKPEINVDYVLSELNKSMDLYNSSEIIAGSSKFSTDKEPSKPSKGKSVNSLKRSSTGSVESPSTESIERESTSSSCGRSRNSSVTSFKGHGGKNPHIRNMKPENTRSLERKYSHPLPMTSLMCNYSKFPNHINRCSNNCAPRSPSLLSRDYSSFDYNSAGGFCCCSREPRGYHNSGNYNSIQGSPDVMSSDRLCVQMLKEMNKTIENLNTKFDQMNDKIDSVIVTQHCTAEMCSNYINNVYNKDKKKPNGFFKKQ